MDLGIYINLFYENLKTINSLIQTLNRFELWVNDAIKRILVKRNACTIQKKGAGRNVVISNMIPSKMAIKIVGKKKVEYI